MISGDNIRGQNVFDAGNLIFQAEFLLLEAAQRKLIGTQGGFHGMDRLIKVTVFLSKHAKFDAQNLILVHFELAIHGYLVRLFLGL